MSANASWKAAWSGGPGSIRCGLRPSRTACVTSWATMSCETRVDRLVGELQVAEEDAAVVPRVVRIRLRERVRDEVELVARERPGEPTPERLLERGQRPGRDRVDVLRVEVEVGDEPGVVDALRSGRGSSTGAARARPQRRAGRRVAAARRARRRSRRRGNAGREGRARAGRPGRRPGRRRSSRPRLGPKDPAPRWSSAARGGRRRASACRRTLRSRPRRFSVGSLEVVLRPQLLRGSSSRVNQPRSTLDGAVRS